jgi:hypothetical protein
MNSITTANGRKEHRDEMYWTDIPNGQPVEYDFHISEPPPKLQPKGRHIFTNEERERGWTNAKLSVDERYPDARCKHGAALSHCLLRRLHPEKYQAIKDEQQARAQRA